MGLVWALPFAGILLSIALMPLLAPSFWHHHYGKVALGWAAAFVLPYLAMTGAAATAYVVLHTLLFEYILSSSCCSRCSRSPAASTSRRDQGSAATNTTILAIGTVLASFVGTPAHP